MKNYILILFLILPFTIYSQENMKKDWANLNKYATENEILKTAPIASKSVVFMGDSITEFWKVNNTNFFASNNFVNRGISGQTTPQMLLRFRQDVIELNPSTVVILAGINDIAENTGPITIDAIFGNIVSMCELAKSNKIKVVLCSVLPANHFNWSPKIEPADKVIALNKLIKLYADKNKITFVDYYSALVDQNKGLDKKYGEDGVHPNLEGYKLMEKLILKVLF
ncbi:SGNH/GDSL hydrolase family protein [Flavobacterium sp. SUN052]|uniref:SGNH/GDSL hydrolase family protein n=1 Tax=Flavobacterium sp. SUN052 TaxID=3002441 RepID=UPI00237D743C|nr:SGNH/GDSL hydrolase family protein [Flavobacterium sp. SUN052]MEC4005099.1 SGNH/GDSL hydrolase family protein [Flavobacterium sp. SUN052]